MNQLLSWYEITMGSVDSLYGTNLAGMAGKV